MSAARLQAAAALAGVTLLALLLRTWGLADEVRFDDDLGALVSAVHFVEAGVVGPTMWHHPHLRDLLVYAAVAALGAGKLALCAPTVALGVLAVPLLGLVAWRLLGNPWAGVLAAFLLCLDAVHVDFSRQSMVEVYMMAFTLAGLLGALEYRRSGRTWPLALAGCAFGLGLAAKWYVAFALAPIAALLLLHDWRAHPEGRGARAAFVAAALGLVPAAVYLAAWAPYFASGRDLQDLWTLHVAMAREALVHQGHSAFAHTLPHRAWAWFLWPQSWVDVGIGDGLRGEAPVILVAWSNPLVWLLVLPAVGWLTWRWWEQRSVDDLLVLAGFWCSWLPFVLTGRPIWLHSAFAPLPFALVAVAGGAKALWEHRPGARPALVLWLGAVALVAVPLVIMAAGGGRDFALLRPLVDGFRPAWDHGP